MIQMEGVDQNMIANNLESFCLTHPGEVLKDEVEARGISQKELAENMGMSYKAMNDMLNERRPVTTESALMFEAALGISAETLLKLQMEYNIAKARRNKSFLNRLSAIGRVACL